MRIAGSFLAAWLAATSFAGCKTKPDADAAAATDPNAAKQQEELLKRRDALITARQKLLADRATIQQEIRDSGSASSVGTGSAPDLGDLQRKLDEIQAKLDNNGNDTTKLLQEEEARPTGPTASNQANPEVARELAQLRELEDAARKAERDAREAADGYRKAAEEWKGTCNAGTTIVAAPVQPVKGTFTKQDVQGVLTRARVTMGRKGLRQDDLGPAGGLEAEATKAMQDGEWGHAMGAANQLNATVDAIKIDRAFIQNKFERLKAYVAAHKESATQASGALQDITQKFGDGNYDGANRRMNELWAQLAH
jgi:hypothetical protein